MRAVVLMLVLGGGGHAADQPFRAMEQIKSPRHEYRLHLGGTIDATCARDPIVYSACEQRFEPMRSVTLENVGETEVLNPWISVNGKRNWQTTADIALEAIRTYGDPARMTDAEKARAIWEFLRRHRFHATSGDLEVRDPVKVFNLYGYALCGDNAPVLMDLWRAAGLPVRRGFPIGHCVAEVWYNSAWHMLDADESVIFLERDNQTICSEQSVARDHDLSKRAYTNEYLAALYNYDGSRSGDLPAHAEHRMQFSLRPGESIQWRWDPAEKHHFAPNPVLFDLKSADLHEWGKKAWSTLRNGKWTYAPRLSTSDSPPIWKIHTPYVIVGGRLKANVAAGRVTFELSYDGRNWKEVARSGGGLSVSLDQFFPSPGPACYEYFLRADTTQGLESVTIENDLQMAPLAMPALELGDNKILYTDETRGERQVRTTFEWVELSIERPRPPSGPVFPGNGAKVEGTMLDFSWQATPGAAAYHFELSDEPGMRWALSPTFDVLTAKPQYALPSAGLLNPGQKYFWRARAKSPQGVWGPWSKTWSFVPQAPGVPVHVRIEQKHPGKFTLAWDRNPVGRKPVAYRVYASNEKGFTASDQPRFTAVGNQKTRGLFPGQEQVLFAANFLAETTEPFYALTPQHAFYRIVAVDARGNRSGSSDMVEASRPWIYSEPSQVAKIGTLYRYEAKTVQSMGDLGYRDFGPGASYQAAFWDADKPRFSLEPECPRCGNFDPAWLSIDPDTGVVIGTPQPGHAGEYQVNIRVELNGKVHLQSYPLVVP